MAKRTKQQDSQRQIIQKWITIVVLFALMIIGVFKMGPVGLYLSYVLRYCMGQWYWFVLLIIVFGIAIDLYERRHGNANLYMYGAIVFSLFIEILMAYLAYGKQDVGLKVFEQYVMNTQSLFTSTPLVAIGGGLFGNLLYAIFSLLFNRSGVFVVLVVLACITAVLCIPLQVFHDLWYGIVSFFKLPEKQEEVVEEEIVEKQPRNIWVSFEEMKQKRKAKKLGEIQADEPSPKVLLNVTEDKTEEIPVVHIPGTPLTDQKRVFIDVDDLHDSFETTKPQPFQQQDQQPIQQEPLQASIPVPHNAPVKKVKRNGPYKLPNIQILDAYNPKATNHENEESAKEKAELLIHILKNFDVEAQLLDIHIGPSVTQFEIRPDVNVKVSKILGLTDNIKMQLAAKDIRIEAPIPGRNAVGVEIPNLKSTPVKMKEIVSHVGNDTTQPLLFMLGKDLLGNPVTCRLDKMPHLLIAGATGSGKSVCMNAIITSFLLRTNPEDVKMLLIDPKKVEFTPYQSIPHLIGPVINDPTKAANALKVIVRIMDERYNVFALAGVRNIEGYNQMVKQQNGRPNPDGSPCPKALPYIVVIIDELADLMAVAGKDVELSIQRITQLARAAGIHLIVATQRPSVDVITGIIKANIPSRIAFAVSSGTDSRTILDHAGAERLLGYGDMLYMPTGQNSPTRVQGVYVSDDEVRRIAEFCSQQAVPMYDDAFVMLDQVEGNDGLLNSMSDDPLFQEVQEFVIEAQKASTSLLQRRFGIGYNRAARMIDELEQKGVIGPAQGSKPRDVYMKPDTTKNLEE